MGNCHCSSKKETRGNNSSLNQSRSTSIFGEGAERESLTFRQRNKKRSVSSGPRKKPQGKKQRKNSTGKYLAVNSELIVGWNKSSQKEQYKILEKLGEGSYGTVWKVKQRKTNLIRAMKKITKNTNSKNETIKEIINEIGLLKKLDHPHIVKIFEFFIEPEGYYLITEYCGGGELYDAIKENTSFSEPVAANIMYQIFSAINYCHSTTKIIHRDLKPENILIDSKDEQTGFYNVKIIDFGTAKIYEKNKNENKVIGSSYYIAPEVLLKNYNEKCDIWSCGVILYILLSGRAPFTGHRDGDVLQKIKQGSYDLKRKPFDQISVEAKDLIRKCLEMNKNRRISAKDALNHPWFEKLNTKDYFCQVTDYFLQKTVENIRNYKPKNKLQELALTYLVHNLPELEEIKLINKIFVLFNTNGNGKLTREEVKEGLVKYLFKTNKNKNQIEKQVEEIFLNIDNDNNGFIECEEFARAGIDKNIFKAPNVLKFMFDYIDKDHSGEISIDELKEVFHVEDYKDEEKLRDLIRSMDEDLNGQISFKEFKTMMLKIID